MIVGILLPLPFNDLFDYESEENLPLGTIVRVPFGGYPHRERHVFLVTGLSRVPYMECGEGHHRAVRSGRVQVCRQHTGLESPGAYPAA